MMMPSVFINSSSGTVTSRIYVTGAIVVEAINPTSYIVNNQSYGSVEMEYFIQ
jgi:hypothetical protein